MLPLTRALHRKAHFKGDWGQVSTSNLRQERMVVSSGVRVSDALIGRNGSILLGRMDGGAAAAVLPQRRRRSEMHKAMASEDVERIPAISREGMRMSTAVQAIASFCFVLCLLFLISLSGMAATSKEVSTIRSEIAQARTDNTELELRIAALDADVDIPREAAKLGMVSQKSVDVIYLDAPVTRTADSLSEAQETPAAHSEFFATLLGQ